MISDSSEPDRPLSPKAPAGPAREFDSRELLGGQREILIRHGEELYRLSLTRNGKLILRK